MAEVELKTPSDEPKIPHFIGKEVTGDRRYYNSQLRQHPYSSWADL
jgi:CYTH domain-containing protein